MRARETQPEAASGTTNESFCKMEFNPSYWQARQQEAEASKAEEEEEEEEQQEQSRRRRGSRRRRKNEERQGQRGRNERE